MTALGRRDQVQPVCRYRAATGRAHARTMALDLPAPPAITPPGSSPVLDPAQLGVLRGYGIEREVSAGEVLFADGDNAYDLIVVLSGQADIVQAHGRPEASAAAAGEDSVAVRLAFERLH